MSTEEKKTITLKHSIPVPRGDGESDVMTNEITIGKMKVKHLKLMPKESLSGDSTELDPMVLTKLLAGLADIPESAIDEMHVDDFVEVSKQLVDFMGDFLQTGETSSTE